MLQLKRSGPKIVQVEQGIQNVFQVLQIDARYLNQSRKQATDCRKGN